MVIISHNEEQQEENHATEPASIEDFEEHFKANQELTNVDLYTTFPNVNKSTIRSWKKRSLDKFEAEKQQTTVDATAQQIDKNIEKDVLTLKAALKGRFDDSLISNLPFDSQKILLTNIASKLAVQKDPNMSMIPTPTGVSKGKSGIDKYLKIDEQSFREKGYGDVSFAIPASDLYDPDFAKKLKQ